MAARTPQRNNLIAGSFVIGSLALAIFLSFLFSDLSGRVGPRSAYFIDFTIAESVKGVSPGSPVTLGGLRVGRVSGVETRFEPLQTSGGEDVPVGSRVSIQINPRVRLYEGATAIVDAPLLGTLAAIEIASIGGPAAGDPAAPTLVPGDGVLRGIVAPPLLSQSGLGPQDRDTIRNAINDLAGSLAGVRRAVEELDPNSGGGATELRDAIASIRQLADDAAERTPRLLDSATGLMEDARPVLTNIDAGITDARGVLDVSAGLVADARDTLASTRPNLEATISNARSLSDALLEDAQRFEAALDEGLLAIREYRELGEEANAMLRRSDPEVRRTLANLRLVSDQATLFTTEVRAAPWRLLERPNERETKEELVYGAARAYADGASDLRAASESLALAAAALDTESQGASEEEVRALIDRLARAFENYEQFERDMLERFAEN